MKILHLRLPERVLALLKGFGPYAAIEIFLPGGSLIVLGLLTLRHYRHRSVHS